MATCPECDAEIEVDEFDVDKGDQLSCPECGSNLEVTSLSPIELDLARSINSQLLDEPIVQRTVILELKSTNRVSNSFNGIGLPVRVVVHRVNQPIVTGAMMLGAQDAVHHRVAPLLLLMEYRPG